MSEERDQILKKLRDLWVEFGHEYHRNVELNNNHLGYSSYHIAKVISWQDACGKLKDLIDELDPDSLIPVELPLKWHTNFLDYIEVCRESHSRGMLRRCVQCSKCKAGMEVEIVIGEPCTRKRLQCTGIDCGHVQMVSFFQEEQNAKT